MKREDIRILTVARCKYKHDRIVSRHSHPFHHLIYVGAGEGLMQIGGNEYNLVKGNMIVIAPGIEHEFSSHPDNPLQTIEVKCFLDNKRLLEAFDPFPSYNPHTNELVRVTLAQLVQEAIDKRPYYAEIMQASLYQCLFYLLRHETSYSRLRLQSPEPTNNNDPSNLDPQIDEIMAYIRLNLHRKLKLSELGKKFAMSEEHLCRIFSKRLGVSPIQLFNHLRIEKAKEMLVQTELRVTEISDSLGFQNLHHMSRYFAKKVQISPLMYRQKYQDNIYCNLE